MTTEQARDWILGLGKVSLRSVPADQPTPETSSTYSDWGERAPEAMQMHIDTWLVEVVGDDGRPLVVGDLTAHAVWYGPTLGSRAMNIGISLVEDFRGHGIGAIAQRLLAELLHEQGIVRVEASTDVENAAEQRALSRAGFIQEGTLRSAQSRADGLHDLQVWSHLAKPGSTASRR